MFYREWKFERTTRLEPGPWHNEPDKVQWVDEKTGLDCLILRNASLCGYVGVPEGHPWFNTPYGDIDAIVHGGLTYSAFCRDAHGDDPNDAICHIPFDGRSDRVWWLGFDCAHYADFIPGQLIDRGSIVDATYRDIAYVRRNVESLAEQAAAAASNTAR